MSGLNAYFSQWVISHTLLCLIVGGSNKQGRLFWRKTQNGGGGGGHYKMSQGDIQIFYLKGGGVVENKFGVDRLHFV